MRTKILIIILCLSFFGIKAQEEDEKIFKPKAELKDSIVQDTTPKVKIPFGQKIKNLPSKLGDFFKDEKPKPKKALWMTFILPGSGQAYNNKHWKIPIVYVGVGSLSYAIAFNNRNFKRYKRAYINRLDGDDTTIEELSTQDLSDEALQNVREGFRKDLERSYLGLIGFYALVGIDAFVDAHLQGFDVSEDLSWQLKPSFQEQMYTNIPSSGMTLSLTFGHKSKKKLYINKDFEDIKNYP